MMKLVLLLAAFCLVASGQRMEMKWHKNSIEEALKNGKVDEMLARRNRRIYSVLATGRSNIDDYYDNFYLISIGLGTPAQTFTIVPDTGSSNLWVASTVCDDCFGKDQFNPTTSSSYVKNLTQTWSIRYGSGSANGFLAFDYLTLVSSIPKVQVEFGVATHIASVFQQQPVDGIMGLAYRSLSVDNVRTPFGDLIASGVLSSPVFTFWLQQLSGTPQGQIGGAIYWGGVDTANCAGTTFYVGMNADLWYQFPFQSWSVSGTSASGQGGNGIFDSGTSFLIGPTNALNSMAQALGGNPNTGPFQGVFGIPCSAITNPSQPAITFMVQGLNGQTVAHNIQPRNYIIPSSFGQCYLAMQGANLGQGFPTWIFGDTWMRQYCSTFDPTYVHPTNAQIKGRVGFTPTMPNSG